MLACSADLWHVQPFTVQVAEAPLVLPKAKLFADAKQAGIVGSTGGHAINAICTAACARIQLKGFPVYLENCCVDCKFLRIFSLGALLPRCSAFTCKELAVRQSLGLSEWILSGHDPRGYLAWHIHIQQAGKCCGRYCTRNATLQGNPLTQHWHEHDTSIYITSQGRQLVFFQGCGSPA